MSESTVTMKLARCARNGVLLKSQQSDGKLASLTKQLEAIVSSGCVDSLGIEVDSCTSLLTTLQEIHSDHAAHEEVKLSKLE